MHRSAILGWQVGLICAASVALMGAAPQDAGDGSELRSYFSGNGFLNRQLYDLAAEEYRTFLREHPEHEKASVARYGLAVSLYNLGAYEEAITHLTALHGQAGFPYAVEVTMVLGQCHLARGEHRTAAATFEEVVDRHRDHDLADDAAALRAEALYQDGAYREVAEPCELLVQRWPDSPHRERVELLWGLGDMALDRFGAAADRFEQMQRRFPDGAYAAQVGLLLAQSLHRAESFRRAEEEYRKVIDGGAEPFVPDALYGLSSVLHREGRLDEAARQLDRLLDRHADSSVAAAGRFLRGRVAFDGGAFDDAMTFFAPVYEQGGRYADEAAYWLAKCELRLDEPAAAARRLEVAIAQFPQSMLRAEMIYDRGVALVRADRPNESLAVLEGFRMAYPEHALAPEALHLIVLTEHQEQRYDRSLEQCRTFATQYPDDPHAPAVAFVAAENLFLTERFDRAADAYRSFLEAYPADEQVDKGRYRLGMALYHLGDFDGATPLLESVTEGAVTAPVFRPAVLALGDGAFQQERWVAAQSRLEDYLAMGLEQPAADDALLKLGLARQRQDDFEGALQAYDRLLERFDESPHRLQARFERGQALVGSERPAEAVAAFEAVLERGADSPFAPHALNHLGALAVQRGEHAEAAALYGRVVAFDPREPLAAEALYQQGQALMSAERFADAGDAFARLVEAYADGERVPQAAALEAIALARQDRRDEALRQVAAVEREHMDALEPALRAAVLYEKAWCQRGLEHPEEAAETYRALIAGSREGTLRLYGMLELAEIEMDAERYEQAVAHLRELRAIDDDEPLPADVREQAAYQLGVCHYQLEDHERAAELLETFLDAYPKSERAPMAGLLCGESLFELGRHERAVERLRPVIEGDPKHEAYGPALLRAGECLAVLQEWDRAETSFERYLQRFADAPLWYQAEFGVGWARENRGEHDRAIEAYRQVVDRHQGPTAARAQFQIGECLFAQEKYQDAARELLKVDILYAYPQWSAAAIFEAGRCFEELSNPVDARRHFQQVIDQHAGTTWAQLATARLEALSRTALPGHPSR